MASLKDIRESEPVRVWMYPLLLAVMGIAVAQGYIDTDTQGLIELVLMSLLGIGGVEGVRGRVAPVRPAQHVLVNPAVQYDIPGRHAVDHDLDGDGIVDDTEYHQGGAHASTEQFPRIEG
jgi:hypothetical protein